MDTKETMEAVRAKLLILSPKSSHTGFKKAVLQFVLIPTLTPDSRNPASTISHCFCFLFIVFLFSPMTVLKKEDHLHDLPFDFLF